MPDTATPFQCRITRDEHGLHAIAGWADTVIPALGLAQRPAYAFRLCLEEAVANLVMHGRPTPERDSQVIDLLAEPRNGGCVLTIIDHCIAFDPTTMAPPKPATPRDALTPGGMGLRLLRHFATTVGYQAERGGNRLVMGIGCL